MKHKILSFTLAACLITGAANAQREVAQFQVNQQNFVICSNFSANKPLEFFSSVRGGKHIITTNTLQDGSITHSFPEDVSPAFVLNHKTSANPSGDNKVFKLPPKEFIANNIQFELTAGNALITWDAQIHQGNAISFQILRSIDHGAYQVIHTVIGTDDDNMNSFSFADTYQGDTRYKFQIMKNGNTLRYATSNQSQNAMLKSKAALESVKVYPTLFQEDITVEIPKVNLPATASILDLNGRVIKNIAILETSQTITLSNCAKGNYFIQLHGQDLDQTTKLTKN